MKFIGILSFYAAAAAAAPLAHADCKASATPCADTPSMSSVPNSPMPGELLVKADVIAKAKAIISEAHTKGHAGHEAVSAPQGKGTLVDVDAEIQAIIDLLDKTGTKGKQDGELLKDEQHYISIVVAKLNEKLDLEHQLSPVQAKGEHANATLTHEVSTMEVDIKSVLSKLQETNIQGEAVAVHVKVDLLVQLLSLLTAKVEADIKAGAVYNRGVYIDVEVHELTLKLARLLTVKAGLRGAHVNSTNASANVDVEIHSVLVRVLGLLRVDAGSDAKAGVSNNNTISGDESSDDGKIQLLGALLKVLAKADVDVKAKVDADVKAQAHGDAHTKA